MGRTHSLIHLVYTTAVAGGIVTSKLRAGAGRSEHVFHKRGQQTNLHVHPQATSQSHRWESSCGRRLVIYSHHTQSPGR